MKKTCVTRAMKDNFAARILAIAVEHGAKLEEERHFDGNHEFPARFVIDTVAGTACFSGDIDPWGSSVYMRFQGDMDRVRKEIRWPELNQFSGKCNLHLDLENDPDGKIVLGLLATRLTLLTDPLKDQAAA